MNWQPTKYQLELAALAGGVKGEWSDTFPNPPKGEPMFIRMGGGMWQPHLPTTQGKADLLDLMLAAHIGHGEGGDCIDAWHADFGFEEEVPILNGNKHAALAQAAITVAALVGEKMKEKL